MSDLLAKQPYTIILGLKSNLTIIPSKKIYVQNVPTQTIIKVNRLWLSTFPYIGTAQSIIDEAKGTRLLCLNYIRLDPEMRKITHNKIHQLILKETHSSLLYLG